MHQRLIYEFKPQGKDYLPFPFVDSLMKSLRQPLTNGWWINFLIFLRHKKASITCHDIIFQTQFSSTLCFHETIKIIDIQVKCLRLQLINLTLLVDSLDKTSSVNFIDTVLIGESIFFKFFCCLWIYELHHFLLVMQLCRQVL